MPDLSCGSVFTLAVLCLIAYKIYEKSREPRLPGKTSAQIEEEKVQKLFVERIGESRRKKLYFRLLRLIHYLGTDIGPDRVYKDDLASFLVTGRWSDEKSGFFVIVVEWQGDTVFREGCDFYPNESKSTGLPRLSDRMERGDLEGMRLSRFIPGAWEDILASTDRLAEDRRREHNERVELAMEAGRLARLEERKRDFGLK